MIPATVTTIGDEAFADTKLTDLDLSKATSLVSIADSAFFGTDLRGTLVVPAKVTTIGPHAFANTKLTGLDLSKASSLEGVGTSAFDNIKLDNIKPVVGRSALLSCRPVRPTNLL